MNEWIQRYLDCRFPIIPLAQGTKCPVVRGWEKDSYRAELFRNRNVGVRAGERVNVGGREGHLMIVDFDSPDLALLKQLCSTVPLTRTTCVRTGGEHRGYHLFYLTESETRKRGMLAFRSASVDLLGKGSFAVVPPSTVQSPYRYLVGLEEIALLPASSYEQLVSTLSRWKHVNNLLKRIRAGKLDRAKALDALAAQNAAPDLVEYFQAAAPVAAAEPPPSKSGCNGETPP